MTSPLRKKLQTIVRINRPAPTVISFSLIASGTLLLVFALLPSVTADSPVRIKSTRTSSPATTNLSTTRVRVSNASTPTRISTIRDVTATTVTPSATKPSVQKAAVQNPAPTPPTPSAQDTDSFLPITEVEVQEQALQQPAQTVQDFPNPVLQEPVPPPTITEPSPTNPPPVLLIGQDPEPSTEPVVPDTPQASPEAEEPPQAQVADPVLGGLENLGAAIQVAQPVDPNNCGTPDCTKANALISAKPISEISLDISPSFKPNLDQKPPKLQQESRQWRDRNGNTLATGQLADYAFSSIYIQEAQGKRSVLPIDKLSVEDICYIADAWGFPKQCRIDNNPFEQRAWEKLNFHWRASAVAHKPVYFEDSQLERHGHTLGPWLQPMRSGAHFFTNIAILPYHMGIHPWNECQYALGYHRPGSIAPRVKPAFPISKKAALIQAGSVLGGVFIIP